MHPYTTEAARWQARGDVRLRLWREPLFMLRGKQAERRLSHRQMFADRQGMSSKQDVHKDTFRS